MLSEESFPAVSDDRAVQSELGDEWSNAVTKEHVKRTNMENSLVKVPVVIVIGALRYARFDNM